MGEIDVVPADLIDAAAELSAAREELGGNAFIADIQTFSPVGGGQLSGGGFYASQQADQLLRAASARLQNAARRAGDQCLALSSALNIVADVYTSADLEEAVAFAFVEPGASTPPGLGHLAGKDNVRFDRGHYHQPAPKPASFEEQMAADNTHPYVNYPRAPIDTSPPPPEAPGNDNHHDSNHPVPGPELDRTGDPWGPQENYEPPLPPGELIGGIEGPDIEALAEELARRGLPD